MGQTSSYSASCGRSLPKLALVIPSTLESRSRQEPTTAPEQGVAQMNISERIGRQRMLGVAVALAASVVMFATAAHSQDALVIHRGVDWKCHDGIIMRYDRVDEKREEGGYQILTITGIPRGFNNLHITCGKRGCPVLNGKRCAIED